MSPMRLIILVGAAMAAMAAAFLVRNMSKPTTVTQIVPEIQTQLQEVSEVQILVARRNLEIGDRLATSDFEWAPWPKANVAEGYLTEAKAPDAIEQVAGAIVRIPIFNREPINPAKLVLTSDSSVMAAILSPGMRAMSVEISTESASGGFILPNDKVDVILTHEIQVQTEQMVTERPSTATIIKNVRVLAIDQVFKPDEEGGSSQIGNTATLELSEKEAELIAQAQRMGTLSLALRPWSDAGEGQSRDSRTDLLTGGSGMQGGITVFRNGTPTTTTGLGGS
ncbi:MAG: Flp pilus assembly protein CpaB [Alphaproteobacteria bacterium]|nr:Flp pilus assembly protein CpaB [Alphaproteobacteria bacterium]